LIEQIKIALEKIGEAKIALVGFPFDVNSSYLQGPAQAPPLIREAFHCESANMWSELGIDLGDESLIFDAGDLETDSPSKDLLNIEKTITLLLNHNLIPLSLGGDHSITYPIIKAIHEKYPDLQILHIDAHPDLYNELQGNRHSHACPFARIMENGLAQRLVQVGIRGMNGHQRAQAKKFGVQVLEMKDWRDDIRLEFDGPLYISFDLDGLDPAFAPGVSHFEPGGLTTRQAIQIIHRVKTPKFIGADIVEFNPQRDGSGMTAMVSAKILKEITARMLLPFTNTNHREHREKTIIV